MTSECEGGNLSCFSELLITPLLGLRNGGTGRLVSIEICYEQGIELTPFLGKQEWYKNINYEEGRTL